MKIFVGNLRFSIDDDALRREFEGFGEIVKANVLTDRETGRSRGFGFVEFESHEDAITAMHVMDGKDFDGRAIKVSEAKPMEKRR